MKNKICGASFKSVLAEFVSFYYHVMIISWGAAILIYINNDSATEVQPSYIFFISIAIVWAFIECILRAGKSSGNLLESDYEIIERNKKRMHDLTMVVSSLVIFCTLWLLFEYITNVIIVFL